MEPPLQFGSIWQPVRNNYNLQQTKSSLKLSSTCRGSLEILELLAYANQMTEKQAGLFRYLQFFITSYNCLAWFCLSFSVDAGEADVGALVNLHTQRRWWEYLQR